MYDDKMTIVTRNVTILRDRSGHEVGRVSRSLSGDWVAACPGWVASRPDREMATAALKARLAAVEIEEAAVRARALHGCVA